MKDLEKEKDALWSGLEVLEHGRLWYLQRLSENRALQCVESRNRMRLCHKHASEVNRDVWILTTNKPCCKCQLLKYVFVFGEGFSTNCIGSEEKVADYFIFGVVLKPLVCKVSQSSPKLPLIV